MLREQLLEKEKTCYRNVCGLALLLASVGIYGVISYSVAQRIHEVGIRMAFGAHKRDVFRMVAGQGLALALAGLAIGVVAALILTRVLSSFSRLLYGVGASDPATLAVSMGRRDTKLKV